MTSKIFVGISHTVQSGPEYLKAEGPEYLKAEGPEYLKAERPGLTCLKNIVALGTSVRICKSALKACSD